MQRQIARYAHIVSKPWAWPPSRAHAVMLAIAWREHDRREAVRQIIRPRVAAPGSPLSRNPAGNTARGNVPIPQPLRLPADLAGLLATTDAT